MLCSVQRKLFWGLLCVAIADAQVTVCGSGEGSCSENPSRTKILRRLLRKNGAVLGAKVTSTAGRTSCLAHKAIYKGDVIFEIPLAVALKSSASSNRFSLSEIEGQILHLAILMKEFSEPKNGDSPLAAYAGQLAVEPLPNATVLWPAKALATLAGTEAQEVTAHFLRRISQIYAAAPLALDLADVKVAFAHYYSRRLKVQIGSQQQQHFEPMLLPGIDWCRHREGSAKIVLVHERQVVQLRASGTLQAGDEIFVDAGVHDNTDFILRGDGCFKPNSGEVLTVPLIDDETSAQKRLLFKQLNWPLEIRLTNGLQDLKRVRMAFMPKEEFTSWSVGALIAGAPLAVSRAFRTEVQATAFLLTECSTRGTAARSSDFGGSAGEVQAEIAYRYRKTVTEIYEKCEVRTRAKLDKLLTWAMKQHEWIFNYIQEAISAAERRIAERIAASHELEGSQLFVADLLKPPVFEDRSLALMADMIAALVNTKVHNFVDYFQQLLQASVGPGHLERVRRLAVAMGRLKGASRAPDLSDFGWINHVRGSKKVLAVFKYLLPEMEKLAEEFQRPTLQ